ncbi:MAG: AtpZ/AtpI family protein, partial [Acidobacteriota bacterium]|nr:AtpZ/AtpI family protein [Acidobacteriota bacterium]
MIKSIFEEDEDEKIDEAKSGSTLSIFDPHAAPDPPAETDPKTEENGEVAAGKVEIPKLEIGGPEDVLEVPLAGEGSLAEQISAIETELAHERKHASPDDTSAAKTDPGPGKTMPKTADSVSAPPAKTEIVVSKTPIAPESTAESIRNSGLAYSAAIALTGSVVFMLIMGWFADLLLGTTPWGIVIGIVIGAAIGFMQFFRLTAQIVNPKPSDFEKVSLLNQSDYEVFEEPV